MPIFSKEEITFDKAARWFFGILFLVAAFFAISYLKSVLLPFVIAIVLAYLLNPEVEWIQKQLKLKNKGIAVAIGLLSIGGFIFGLCMLLSPFMHREIAEINEVLQKYAMSPGVSQEDPAWIATIKTTVQSVSSNEELRMFFEEFNFGELATNLFSSSEGVFSSGASILGGLMSFVMVLLYLIFALTEYDVVFNGWRNLVPNKHQSKMHLVMLDFKKAMSNYFRAQTLVAMCVGVLFAIGFSIIGLPLAILFGLFIGLLNMVPYLQLAAIVPGLFLGAIHSLESGNHIGFSIGMVLAVFFIVQLIQDLILVPKIMGQKTGLNAVLILLGLSVWGQLLGFIGLIVAIPFTYLALSYYKRYIALSDIKEKRAKDTGN